MSMPFPLLDKETNLTLRNSLAMVSLETSIKITLPCDEHASQGFTVF